MQANIQKVKRRIVDFIHKYSTEQQVMFIAKYLGISTEDKKEREEKS